MIDLKIINMIDLKIVDSNDEKTSVDLCLKAVILP
jgi:hypothetical protein